MKAFFSTPKSIKARSKAKAKAKAKANERGKPRDILEKYEVKRRLKKKYPQMYKEGWGEPRKKDRTSSTVRGLRAAGISSDEMPTDAERRKGK
ncbi:MAG: hypothetical protein JRE28_10370 [Deltaproteobacteria bacterium]|nr:hypothetical protein [Deltaproteobacteria bacterium]